ncbi:class I SAM-dependent methyltransferase [Lysobacter enzymogenes]|uniref:class I SAM-dependent methyltransferase n=1 Tax=Lysobacter enzymogenes TaxID=69 RepID=UPI002263F07D|nr:class I SAM-dependent methyltransferase [Lysobacter enzymogenes]UZW58538.1 class I SAM-dependent methyltransferase [Lysobacter enzymogenes]
MPGDPQTTQIYERLAGEKCGEIKVLDYGAGKGRLLSELTSHDGALTKIDYFAYDLDPSAVDQAAVKGCLSTAYEDGDSRYVIGKAKSALLPWRSKFDAVILCNALHEISPEAWSELFGEQGEVVNVLSENGHLLIVEDYVLAVGERAHRFGFLLLDKKELAVLFDAEANEIITINHQKEEYRDRLKIHVIPRGCWLE